jgi:hypothetical protein
MPDVNYKIGGLKINKDRLELSGSDSYKASHKFVAEGEDRTVSIFVAEGKKHPDTIFEFNLDEEKLVGGGSLYLDKEKRLVLSDYSGCYGTIPKEAAQNFVELIAKELEKEGITINGVVASPKLPVLGMVMMRRYWKNLGFE